MAIKEKLQEYALIAEIIGSLAIVASLVFVGVQVQQNTNLTKANAYRETIKELADWREFVGSDSESIGCYRAYFNLENDTFDATLCDKMGIVVNNIFEIYETAYFDNLYGFIGDAEWARLEAVACSHFSRAQARNTLPRLTEEFEGFLNDNCN